MTERLYYTDSYLKDFTARVLDAADGGRRLYLDRTAFYPTSGGQPFDRGTIGAAAVVDVVDEGERIAHVLAEPGAEAGEAVCAIDWARRFDHMQQHSGQHLLSAVFVELLGVQTVSFHLGQESSTIDLEAPALGAEQVRAAELRANELAAGNRPVTVTFAAPADSLDLRKAPEREGTLRIVTIEGLDRSACGGTHVRASGEIGPILIRKLSKVRDTVRVEFLCGLRAVRRARADYDALSAIAQAFSAPPDDAPLLVQSLQESAREAGKVRRRLEEEIAGYQGRELYAATPPDAAGLRRLRRRGTLDELRPLAQSFCSQAGAVFVGIVEDPPALLLATSSDSGVDAGNRLRAAVTEAGGRGGGNARLAQGSVPSREMLDVVAAKLEGTSQALRT